MFSFMVASFLLIGLTSAIDFSYRAQGEWPPVCVQGNEMRQSPIDIVTESVDDDDDDLDALQLSGWELGHDGTFTNLGHTVQFVPDTTGVVQTQNHLGTYDLIQFHMHWGARTGEGSEHLIDGIASELEIHFVHLQQGVDNPNQGGGNINIYTVIAVMAKVDDNAPLTGPWEQLNATAVREYRSTIPVTGFRLDQFLPESRDYYYYEGSLTTPPCTEIVAWFVLKEAIAVPGTYLNLLRQTSEGANGTLQDFNFRMPQAIGGRVVSSPSNGSQDAVKTTPPLLAFCLVMIKLFF